MYKKQEHENEFIDFYLPFGGHLRSENRWVKLAKLIPWEELEPNYAIHFSKKMGRKAKPFRVALGALLIKEKLQLTDEETVEQIRETPYLQYFLGYQSYQDEILFDASMMTHFRKRLGKKIIQQANEAITKRHVESIEKEHDDNDDEKGNRGKLIIDATCVPQDIRHPNDVGLLDDARMRLEQIIDELYKHSSLTKKPRTYRIRARREYLKYAKRRRKTRSQIRRATRKQLQYVRRNLKIIKELMNEVPLTYLSKKQSHDLRVIQKAFDQQMHLYRNRIHGIRGKVVSIAQPHVRPIARGKAKAAFEFGAKISASRTEHGMFYIDRLSWEPYNEGADLPMQVEEYSRRFGRYPESVHADRIYRTRENRRWCEERGIRLSGPPLGRPREIDVGVVTRRKRRRQEKDDERIRQTIESCFGVGKRTYSLACVYEKLRVTSETTIMINMMLMNLEKILKRSFRQLFLWTKRLLEHQNSSRIVMNY